MQNASTTGFYTTTVSAPATSSDASTPTATPTATATAPTSSPAPTQPCPVANASAALRELPWFAGLTLSDDDIRRGIVVNVSLITVPSANGTHRIVAATAYAHSPAGGGYGGAAPMLSAEEEGSDAFVGSYGKAAVSCEAQYRRLSEVYVGGNPLGFRNAVPPSVTFSPSSTVVPAGSAEAAALPPSAIHASSPSFVVSHKPWALLALAPLPQYSIDEAEGLDVYVPLATIVGSLCAADADVELPATTSDGLVLIGGLRVEPARGGLAPAEDATTGVSVGGAVVDVILGGGGAAAEQMGLAAMGLMTCADPHTRGAFGSFRALSPFAIWDSYLGVVVGNAVFLAAVFCIQLIVLLVLRAAKRVRRWEELSALARFPSVLLNCSFALHMGTAYSASQLITLDNMPLEDRVIGALAFAFVVVYPFGLIGFAFKFVGRAYQSYAMADYLRDHPNWPAWVSYCLPQGAIYAVETRRTFGPLVSAYRLSGAAWPSYPTWTPMIFAIGGLFHPDTIPKCQALFVCMGLAFVALCVLVLFFSPRRSSLGCWLDAAARGLSAAMLFAMAVAIEKGDLGRGGAMAAFALGLIQTSATVIRALYSLVITLFDRQLQQLPLTHEWVHYTSDGAKTAKRFGHAEELLGIMQTEAEKRDDGEVNGGDDHFGFGADEALVLKELDSEDGDAFGGGGPQKRTGGGGGGGGYKAVDAAKAAQQKPSSSSMASSFSDSGAGGQQPPAAAAAGSSSDEFGGGLGVDESDVELDSMDGGGDDDRNDNSGASAGGGAIDLGELSTSADEAAAAGGLLARQQPRPPSDDAFDDLL